MCVYMCVGVCLYVSVCSPLALPIHTIIVNGELERHRFN